MAVLQRQHAIGSHETKLRVKKGEADRRILEEGVEEAQVLEVSHREVVGLPAHRHSILLGALRRTGAAREEPRGQAHEHRERGHERQEQAGAAEVGVVPAPVIPERENPPQDGWQDERRRQKAPREISPRAPLEEDADGAGIRPEKEDRHGEKDQCESRMRRDAGQGGHTVEFRSPRCVPDQGEPREDEHRAREAVRRRAAARPAGVHEQERDSGEGKTERCRRAHAAGADGEQLPRRLMKKRLVDA
jgi:hypothetical protein